MATQSVNKGFPIPENLADTGQWGVLLDQTMAQLDKYLGGVARPDMSTALAGTYTVSADDAQNLMHLIGGAAGQPITYLLPQIPGIFVIVNNCGQPVTVKTSAGSGTSVPVANNTGQTVYCDRTNVGLATTSGTFSSLTISGALNAGSATFSGSVEVGSLSVDNAATVATLRATTSMSTPVLNVTGNTQTSFAAGINAGATSAIVNANVSGTIALSFKGVGLKTTGQSVLNLAGVQTVGGVNGFVYGPTGGGAYTGSISYGLVVSPGSIFSTQFAAASDRRRKDNIRDIPLADGIKFVSSVPMKYFTIDGMPRAGHLAQDQIAAGLGSTVHLIPMPGLEADHDSPADAMFSLPPDDRSAYLGVVVLHLLKVVNDLENRIGELEGAL